MLPVIVEPNELGIGELFGRVRDAVIVADAATGRILLWNPAATEVLGYSQAEALDMALETLVPPSLRQAHRDGLARFAKSDGAVLRHNGIVLDLPALHRSGRELAVEVTLTPLEGPAGHPLALAIIRDVTARQTAARALEDAQQASEQANRALRDFIGMVAHDLRGPLAAVGGFVALLQTGHELSPDDRADALARMARQLAHMDGIVGDLLTATELEAGSTRTDPLPVDVRAAIAQAADACGGVDDLEVNCPESLHAYVDPKHLVRCVANYLQNAVKYGQAPFVVTARKEGSWVDVRVIDAGEGIPATESWRIFDRFARVEATAYRPGLGLGLSIVRGLADANGGNAWYEAPASGGACFVLRVPAAG
ncbi:MAG: hypothetical protein NVS3B12_06400 [Acidimicrobiales bacterium]